MKRNISRNSTYLLLRDFIASINQALSHGVAPSELANSRQTHLLQTVTKKLGRASWKEERERIVDQATKLDYLKPPQFI